MVTPNDPLIASTSSRSCTAHETSRPGVESVSVADRDMALRVEVRRLTRGDLGVREPASRDLSDALLKVHLLPVTASTQVL
jgi:hypothetical protein